MESNFELDTNVTSWRWSNDVRSNNSNTPKGTKALYYIETLSENITNNKYTYYLYLSRSILNYTNPNNLKTLPTGLISPSRRRLEFAN